MSAFLDLIKTRPVFYDGSMGATILNLGLTPEEYGGQATEGFQFMPPQTTAAIVIHHPGAKYFALLRSGGIPDVEQEPVAAVGD